MFFQKNYSAIAPDYRAGGSVLGLDCLGEKIVNWWIIIFIFVAIGWMASLRTAFLTTANPFANPSYPLIGIFFPNLFSLTANEELNEKQEVIKNV